MGFVKKLFKAFGAAVVVFVGVLLGPNTLPESTKFTEFRVTPTKDFGDVLAPNDLLNNAERLFEDEIKGPEAFEVINGELYTILHGGFVAKVFDDQIVPVVKFGEPCVGWWEEKKCGRPLGIKAYGKDSIIVADAYFGIFMYNINTRKITNLVDKNTIIDGIKPKIFNSIEVGKDGSIYWTHSSTDFLLEDSVYLFLADGTGRLIRYDPRTQKNEVLMKNLYFANGLIMSPNKDFLLVVESGHSRIHRYYLEGPNKYKTDIFIDGLPGVPDNLKENGQGGFFAPMIVTKDEKNPLLFQIISPFPKLREFVARSLSYFEILLNKIQEIYPNYYLQRAIHYTGHLESVSPSFPIKATILEIDINGNIVASYQCNDGSVVSVSEVIVHNGYLYLGSPINNYIARVKLSKLGNRYSGKMVKKSVAPPSAPRMNESPSPTIGSTRPPSMTPPPAKMHASSPSTTATPPPPPSTRPPPPPSTTERPLPPSTKSPPPPSTTAKPPPSSTRSPPPSTPPSTRPPLPSTTPSTRPPPPSTTPSTRPPPPSTPPSTRPPPPSTTSTSRPSSTHRPPSPAQNTPNRVNGNPNSAQKKPENNS